MSKRTTRGAAFAASVRGAYDLNEAESIIVDEVAAVLDVLEAGGLSVAEARQQRVLLSRLLGQLGLPTVGEDQADRQATTSRKARAAARSRWTREAG